MSHSHVAISCDVCNESFRAEVIINHYKRDHPEYLCNRIIPLKVNDETGRIDIGSQVEMRNFIETMNCNPTPFYIGETNDENSDSLYTDFSNGHGYVRSQTAMKHVIKNADKHRNNWFRAVYEGITPDKLVLILKYMRQKPERIVDEELVAQLRDEITDLKSKRDNWHNQWCELKRSTEASTTPTNTIVESVRVEELEREIKSLRERLEDAQMDAHERMNLARHRISSDEIEYTEQVKQQYAKWKKEVEKEHQKAIKALEKKHKAKMKKMKAAAVDSDSDTDSD
jgi:hypothetical protein